MECERIGEMLTSTLKVEVFFWILSKRRMQTNNGNSYVPPETSLTNSTSASDLNPCSFLELLHSTINLIPNPSTRLVWELALSTRNNWIFVSEVFVPEEVTTNCKFYLKLWTGTQLTPRQSKEWRQQSNWWTSQASTRGGQMNHYSQPTLAVWSSKALSDFFFGT